MSLYMQHSRRHGQCLISGGVHTAFAATLQASRNLQQKLGMTPAMWLCWSMLPSMVTCLQLYLQQGSRPRQ